MTIQKYGGKSGIFKCSVCGMKFRSKDRARHAAYNGCPGCGTIDLDFEHRMKYGNTIKKIPKTSFPRVGGRKRK